MKTLKKRLKTLISLLLVMVIVLTNNSILLEAAIPDNYYYALQIGDKVGQNATLNYAYIEWYMIDNYSNYVFEFTDDVGTTTVNGPIIYPSLTKADVVDTQLATITKLDNSTIDIYDLWAYEYGGKIYYYKNTEYNYNKGFSECILFHSSDSLSLTRDRGSAKEYTEVSEFDISSVPSDVPKTVIGAGGHPYETCYVRVSTPTIRTIGINEWTVTDIQYNNSTAIISLSAKTPQIVGIDANYNGNSVLIGNEFNENQVEIYVDYDDGSYDTISYSQLETKPASKIVNNLEWNNQYEIEYKGFTDTFEVHGYDYERIEAEYNGVDIKAGQQYKKEDVTVTAYYTDNLQNDLSGVVKTSDWTPNSTTVTEVGNNTFTATLNKKSTLTANYIVKGLNAVTSLTAEYKGEDIYVGGNYKKEDVTITAYFKEGSPRVLDTDEWSVDSFTVQNVGTNTYTVTYDGITTNLTVPGYKENMINATYIGEDIKVGENYNKSDVRISVFYTNGTTNDLLSDEWQANSVKVEQAGPNVFTATYKGLTDVYTVNGLKEITSITADYEGTDISTRNQYKKSDVKVIVNYHDGSSNVLSDHEWQEDSLFITNEGLNTFTATYKGFTDNYEIMGIRKLDHIIAEYNGSDIIIGEEYKKEDVVITAIFHDYERVVLKTNEWKESSLTVTNVGSNEYTAEYGGLSTNYIVKGKNPIISLTAIYKGQNIEVGENYNKADVEVIATYSDKSTKTIPTNEWKESSLLVEVKGVNTYEASYEGIEASYTVTGEQNAPVLESLVATYKGTDIETGLNYNKADVEVKAIYSDKFEKVLNSEEWKESSLIVQTEGVNQYSATYENLVAAYTVNGIKTIKEMSAEYKGEDIEIGKKYSKKSVNVYVTYHDDTKITLNENEWETNSLKVTKEGDNTFTATYKDKSTTYIVTGYKDEPIVDIPIETEDVPKTGDHTQPIRLLLTLFLSISGIIILFYKSKKEQ